MSYLVYSINIWSCRMLEIHLYIYVYPLNNETDSEPMVQSLQHGECEIDH